MEQLRKDVLVIRGGMEANVRLAMLEMGEHRV